MEQSKPINVYYNSHSNAMDFNTFIQLEVLERNNYSIEEVNSWVQKYDIDPDKALVIWVCDNIRTAFSYTLDSDEIDDFLEDLNHPINETEMYYYMDNAGFIIPESDDGETGYYIEDGKLFYMYIERVYTKGRELSSVKDIYL